VVLMIKPYGLLGREEVAGEHGQVGEPEQPIKPFGWTGRAIVALLILALIAVPMFAQSFIMVLLIDVIVFALFAVSFLAMPRFMAPVHTVPR